MDADASMERRLQDEGGEASEAPSRPSAAAPGAHASSGDTAQRGEVSLNPVAHDGLVVQRHSQPVASPPQAARQHLVSQGLIAAPFVDDDEEEDLPHRARMERDLQQFAKKEVNPPTALKVAHGRKMLAESGILDDLRQMRVANQTRPASAQTRPVSAQAVGRPATATRRLPSDVVRRREISPLYNQTWQEQHASDPRFTGKTVESLTRPLPHRMPPPRMPANRNSTARPVKRPARSQVRGASTESQLDESVYTGHAFAGTQPDIRPASAPPGEMKLDFEALRKFNDAVARGETWADVTHETLEDATDVDPSPSAPQKTSPAKRWGGFSDVEMLTAPEFEHIPIGKLVPTLFSDDVMLRPHRGLLELASKKLVEGKHVKVRFCLPPCPHDGRARLHRGCPLRAERRLPFLLER